MTSKKSDFYGKEVTDAIKKACDKLQVPQEQLEIEVVETGSTGIFGLIRKKAHITAAIKEAEVPRRQDKKKEETPQEAATASEPEKKEEQQKPVKPSPPPEKKSKVADALARTEEKPVTQENQQPEEKAAVQPQEKAENKEKPASSSETTEDLPAEVLDLVKDELHRILELMGYPSTVEVSTKGTSVVCHVDEQHEEILTGQDGKTLDSIQYLLRKIVARKVPNRLRLTVDVGNYREKRLDELRERALELSQKVKDDGKTQVIPALSPSERRVIHISLQEDKEIRSRSVGDGLFKKILIYKPGKGGRNAGRKRNSSRGRGKGSNNNKKNG